MSEDTPKWTEIEHLPAWDEEFYHVYTAKKHGKWVMLKTLRPELAENADAKDMIEKEFDVRYNLAHPNIIMINDFEDVPGLGRCIITDDVYGDSLRKLIDTRKLTAAHIEKLRTSLVSAMKYIQTNHIVHHPIRPERIIFTENIGNLKLIDVGFEQKPALTPHDTAEDIFNYGTIVLEALESSGVNDPLLRRVAERCISADPKRRYKDVDSLQLALDNRKSKYLYITIIIFLTIMVAVLAWFSSPYAPKPPM
ncbi:MAG: protein kinase [Muribaculaceae bacterium]|nr:protein kinase [Muribaculaceae bacterium]MDE6130059.1 protein kinase [Muribaculaceae bacterium]